MKAKKNSDIESELINDVLSIENTAAIDLGDQTTPIVVTEQSELEKENVQGQSTLKSAQQLLAKATTTLQSLNFSKGQKSKPDEKQNIQPTEKSFQFNDHVAKIQASHSHQPPLTLVQSENLRIAQEKIFELETEIQKLRVDNEQLTVAGETLRAKADQIQSENDDVLRKYNDLKDKLVNEREVLENSLQAKDRELKQVKSKK